MENTMECGHGTDIGRVRDHNEDSYLIDSPNGLYIISDGMGGHAAGEVASAVVVDSIAADIKNHHSLSIAVSNAHRAVIDAVRGGHGKAGMGATAVALQVQGSGYDISWVGDSRAYLWDDGLTRLTRDHSYVQKLIDTGVLSDQEARNHPERSVLTRALGAEQSEGVIAEEIQGRLRQGQKLLLCSDGLTGELPDEKIGEILDQYPDNQQAVNALLNAANEHGGGDNITAILVSAPQGAPPRSAKGETREIDVVSLNELVRRKTRKEKVRQITLVILLLFLLAVLGVLCFDLYKEQSQPPRPAQIGGRQFHERRGEPMDSASA